MRHRFNATLNNQIIRNLLAFGTGIAVIGGGGGAPTVQSFNQNAARYRRQVFVQAQNVTNRANSVGYSGTLT